jgi:phosphomannomutase
VLANYLEAHGRLKDDTVVATVMSNVGLEIAFRAVGIKLVRTDVGDKYVLDELLRVTRVSAANSRVTSFFPSESRGRRHDHGALAAAALRESESRSRR